MSRFSSLVDAITRNHDVDLLLPGQKPCAYFVIISAQDSRSDGVHQFVLKDGQAVAQANGDVAP